MWIFHNAGPMAYVVQAKRMKLDQSGSYSYSSLRYKAGSRFQIEALDDFAKGVGVKPLYCFYNNVDTTIAMSHWHCQTEPSPNILQMGCTHGSLGMVKLIHDDPGSRQTSLVALKRARRTLALFVPPLLRGRSRPQRSNRRIIADRCKI